MNPREMLLARIREALSVPDDPHVRSLSAGGTRDAVAARDFLPPGGKNDAERLALFQGLAAKLKAEVHVVPDLSAARECLERLRDENKWERIGSHHHELTDALVSGLSLPVLWTDDRVTPKDLETCPVGISGCEALIAQTGSVLVTGKGCGGRALSVLPPHHIVLATREQLIPDMLDGFALLRKRYGDKLPSLISFITGASRTGDIERILVLGAHGPKRLTIVIIGT
jgi:L-lactate dehydrogenase complex protein LldG